MGVVLPVSEARQIAVAAGLHRVAVGVEYGGRLHPQVHVILGDTFLQEGVDPNRPVLPGAVGCPRPPGFGDAVDPANVRGLGSRVPLFAPGPRHRFAAALPDRFRVVAAHLVLLGLHAPLLPVWFASVASMGGIYPIAVGASLSYR
jgi:hypothetical protein